MPETEPETPSKPAGRARGSLPMAATVVLILFTLFGLPIAAYLKLNPGAFSNGYDSLALAVERRWRLWYARSGDVLPGTPQLAALDERLSAKGFKRGDPVLVRIFKRSFELELWMMREGRYEPFATYPICRFSGRLGPKLRQGDRQAPEGFYTVAKGQLNPASRWHRSFNLGFPNAFDQAHKRTGTFLMVHGGCSSAGCYAMTNAVVDEIWTLVKASLRSGRQKRFQVQAFPFRMTDENLAGRISSRWAGFWRDLKVGHDLFEATRLPPRVSVCQGRYAFADGPRDTPSAPRITRRCIDKPDLARNDRGDINRVPVPVRQPNVSVSADG